MTVGESLSRFKVSMANYQSRTATRWTVVPVLVGILTAQMLQSAHARDIGALFKMESSTDKFSSGVSLGVAMLVCN